jgi:hypothetical protein
LDDGVGPWVTFDELLQKPHKIHFVRRVRENGRDLVHVKVSHKRADQEFWFDPQVNCLLRKVVARYGPEKEGSVERSVSEFQECKPGIFFPTSSSAVIYEKGKRSASYSDTYANIKINEPLGADVFRLEFPPGIMVRDNVKKQLHKTDERGEPRLPPVDSRGTLLHYGNNAPLAAPDGTRVNARQTGEEARPWSWWLLPASLFVLFAGAACWFVQRRRTRRKQ